MICIAIESELTFALLKINLFSENQDLDGL